MVPADSIGVSRDPIYSGTGSSTFTVRLRDYHPLWLVFPEPFDLVTRLLNTGPTTPSRQASKVWALPLSLAATDGIDFSFSSSG